MLIREFDLDRDYEAALALWQAAGPGVHVGVSDTRAELAKKLARDPDLFLAAEAAGQLVGTVIGGFDGRRGMVYHLAVAEAWRGQGLGKQLMTELEERLKAKGCRKYYLLVMPENLAVLDFYRALGWEVMEVAIMAKELPCAPAC
jgi:ribosomal protein S18 acetylase RimI-like enzyme